MNFGDCIWCCKLHTVPNVIIVAKKSNYLRKTVDTTVITAFTQCRNVVTDCNYDGDEDTFATMITLGTVVCTSSMPPNVWGAPTPMSPNVVRAPAALQTQCCACCIVTEFGELDDDAKTAFEVTTELSTILYMPCSLNLCRGALQSYGFDCSQTKYQSA